jgi:hypothetical protein
MKQALILLLFIADWLAYFSTLSSSEMSAVNVY